MPGLASPLSWQMWLGRSIAFLGLSLTALMAVHNRCGVWLKWLKCTNSFFKNALCWITVQVEMNTFIPSNCGNLTSLYYLNVWLLLRWLFLFSLRHKWHNSNVCSILNSVFSAHFLVKNMHMNTLVSHWLESSERNRNCEEEQTDYSKSSHTHYRQ